MEKDITQPINLGTTSGENTNIPPQTSPVGNPIHRLNLLTSITYGILIVLFIGFAGMFVATVAMLVDSFNNKTATYKILIDEVSKQNIKIDSLLNQNNCKIPQ